MPELLALAALQGGVDGRAEIPLRWLRLRGRRRASSRALPDVGEYQLASAVRSSRAGGGAVTRYVMTGPTVNERDDAVVLAELLRRGRRAR